MYFDDLEYRKGTPANFLVHVVISVCSLIDVAGFFWKDN